ncbi:GYD domain-containing protein, partial [Candidatus Micrarchaeota archaeon]|nr:GYD domain-containing protein [Candidatus Micrarchaeota archaeon]
VEGFKKRGIKIIGWYWTLGRYDTVIIAEAANEKEAMKVSIEAADFVATETLVAVPREQAIKLV